MPAISFQGEWLDKLLSCEKQQTTRQQTDRFKVGDIMYMYIEQRRQITEKPLRRMTESGSALVHSKIGTGKYPEISGRERFGRSLYHAHFLGKVEITEVYDVLPTNSCGKEAWATHDGFTDFTAADEWFESRYGEDWMARYWTVIRWDGWKERYFEQ